MKKIFIFLLFANFAFSQSLGIFVGFDLIYLDLPVTTHPGPVAVNFKYFTSRKYSPRVAQIIDLALILNMDLDKNKRLRLVGGFNGGEVWFLPDFRFLMDIKIFRSRFLECYVFPGVFASYNYSYKWYYGLEFGLGVKLGGEPVVEVSLQEPFVYYVERRIDVYTDDNQWLYGVEVKVKYFLLKVGLRWNF